jgi:SAM-dependent methyltransferase
VNGLTGEFHRLADFLAATGAVRSAEEYRDDFPAQSAFVRRCKAYALIARRGAGKRVLDIGCSLGHGARLLAGCASSVVAVDSGGRVLAAAERFRPSRQVRYVRSEALRLPFPDRTFGVVAAFHLIEHLRPQNVLPFLREARRVAENGGEVAIATPNRRFRLLPGQRPFNPEHRQEFSGRFLRRSLAAVFENVSVMGIRGREWVEEIERARLGRSPLRAYLRDPLSALVKCVVPGLRFPRRETRAAAARSAAPPGRGREIGLGDYRADDRYPECGIDLLAVCRKG